MASLPSIHRTERWRDQGIRAPEGVVERRVERGSDPKSRTAIVFTGPWTDAHGPALRAAAEVLQTRLIRVLREDLGGTYTVAVNANVAGLAIASIVEKTCPLRIASSTTPASSDAFPCSCTCGSEIENVRKLRSYDGRCSDSERP